MTPQQAAEIRMRALRQIGHDCVSVHITADQVKDLACAYLDLEQRRAQIADLVPDALVDWACNYRPELHDKLIEIERLAKTVP